MIGCGFFQLAKCVSPTAAQDYPRTLRCPSLVRLERIAHYLPLVVPNQLLDYPGFDGPLRAAPSNTPSATVSVKSRRVLAMTLGPVLSRVSHKPVSLLGRHRVTALTWSPSVWVVTSSPWRRKIRSWRAHAMGSRYLSTMTLTAKSKEYRPPGVARSAGGAVCTQPPHGHTYFCCLTFTTRLRPRRSCPTSRTVPPWA